MNLNVPYNIPVFICGQNHFKQLCTSCTTMRNIKNLKYSDVLQKNRRCVFYYSRFIVQQLEINIIKRRTYSYHVSNMVGHKLGMQNVETNLRYTRMQLLMLANKNGSEQCLVKNEAIKNCTLYYFFLRFPLKI